MFQYTNQQRPGIEPIEDLRNAILLRSDIYDRPEASCLFRGTRSSSWFHLGTSGSILQRTATTIRWGGCRVPFYMVRMVSIYLGNEFPTVRI
jgi:hypothetical protein